MIIFIKNNKIIYLLLALILPISLSGCSLSPINNKTENQITKKEMIFDSSHNSSTNEVDIELIAYNFFFSQNTITVKQGAKVNINLTSVDGQHDIFIEGYNVQSTLADINNQTNIIFVADKVGEFSFYSTVGIEKELGLSGKLIVED